MEEIRILSPTGVIGSGFLESSFERGISMKPHVISCDAGSTDPGPAFLGSGATHFSREGTKRDLRIMLKGRDSLGVPLILGSCGTGGGDAGVDWMRDIALEIANEETLKPIKRKVKKNKYRAFIAVFAGDIRLIDNIALN